MGLLASYLVEVERKVISTKDSPGGKWQAHVGHFFFAMILIGIFLETGENWLEALWEKPLLLVMGPADLYKAAGCEKQPRMD